LIDILEISDLEKLETTLKSLFASIAYNNFTNNHIQNYEGFYAMLSMPTLQELDLMRL